MNIFEQQINNWKLLKSEKLELKKVKERIKAEILYAKGCLGLFYDEEFFKILYKAKKIYRNSKLNDSIIIQQRAFKHFDNLLLMGLKHYTTINEIDEILSISLNGSRSREKVLKKIDILKKARMGVIKKRNACLRKKIG